MLVEENPAPGDRAVVTRQRQRYGLEIGLWLLIPVILLVAQGLRILDYLSIVGCEGACDRDFTYGAIAAYPWEVAASILIAVGLAIVLRLKGRPTYWAPLVGVALVLASAVLTSVLFHAGLAGMYERNARIERGEVPAAPPPPDPVGTWGEATGGEPYLHFAEDGTLVGYDGCNELNGRWAQDADGEIGIDTLPATTNTCDGIDTWLSMGRKADIVEGFLYIRGEVGSAIGGLRLTDQSGT